MADYETLLYEERGGVAYITLNRPEALNSFDSTMMREVQQMWLSLRADDDVRCAVLTGSGERAFCVGIDRNADDTYVVFERSTLYGTSNNYMYDDPGRFLGPKANDLWKPVICAVNGMACGGAFYMLGEVEFIIASDNATFFDPHVSYGMTACFESMHMLQKMPFGEIMRTALLGASERLSAERAYQIGLVSQVVPFAELHDAADWAATEIAKSPPVAIQGTVRSIWLARELSRMQALDAGKILIRLGSDQKSLYDGQQRFVSGERIKPRTR